MVKETEAQRNEEEGSWLHSQGTAELGLEFRSSDMIPKADFILP